MGKKKIDKVLLNLLLFCIKSHQRSLFFILGESSLKQCAFLYHLLLKVRKDEQILGKPSVLWCYKKDSDGYKYLHKKEKKLKKKYAGEIPIKEEDIHEAFLVSTDITFCHFNDTSKVLGQTFGVLILQDFESVTPNILARVTECIEGGGMLIITLPNAQRLEHVSDLKMDVHSRYATYSHSQVEPRFNKRFILSLASCRTCLVLSDKLKIKLLPFNSVERSCTPSKEHVQSSTKPAMQSHPSFSSEAVRSVCHFCCTSDQLEALLKFNETLAVKSKDVTVSLTSARGRGKSATLGLAVSLAIHLKMQRLCVTSPHLENVQTLFAFTVKGLKALSYEEGHHFVVQYSEGEGCRWVSGIKMTENKQSVAFIPPTDFSEARYADLVVIDEAAAIPLPLVKHWMANDKVFLASTINGYEGTGRSLSLKLMGELRKRSQSDAKSISVPDKKMFELHEVTLNEAIRYSNEDEIEAWLNNLFCLNVATPFIDGQLPEAKLCELFYVNRETLFSYHKTAEAFLQSLVALFVSSHYKNSPNDLLMMADAPAHHIFCLLPPADVKSLPLPPILCAVQICLEGKIPAGNVQQENSFGKRASGDLIPWIISQQFQDDSFASDSSARIIRIATHPDCCRMGYGRRALELLCEFYGGKGGSVPQKVTSRDVPERKWMPPLLSRLDELQAERLDYVGVSYGLTEELFRFWKSCGFVPLYLRQTKSEITGEHSCIMVKHLKSVSSPGSNWLLQFYIDFRGRLLNLLASAFKDMPASLAIGILRCQRIATPTNSVTSRLLQFLNPCSIRRLTAYCNHLVDYHLIMDLLPSICQFYFLHSDPFLSSVQEAVLVSLGLQSKSVETLSKELTMETGQVMGLFMKTMKRLVLFINEKKSKDDRSVVGEQNDDQHKVKRKEAKAFSSIESSNSDHFDPPSKKSRKSKSQSLL